MNTERTRDNSSLEKKGLMTELVLELMSKRSMMEKQSSSTRTKNTVSKMIHSKRSNSLSASKKKELNGNETSPTPNTATIEKSMSQISLMVLILFTRITCRTTMQRNASKTKTGICKIETTKIAQAKLFNRRIMKSCSRATSITSRAIKTMNLTTEKFMSSQEAATRQTITSKISSISTSIKDRSNTMGIATTIIIALEITTSKHGSRQTSATCNQRLLSFLKITYTSKPSQPTMIITRTRSRVSPLLHSSQHQRALRQPSNLINSSMKRRLM